MADKLYLQPIELSQSISAQLLRGSAERLLTTHSVMELEISNPFASLRVSLQQQFVLVEE